MSFLNTTAKITHTTRLPQGTTRAQALAMLSDHEFFLTCDPHLAKYERIPPADLAKLSPPPQIPDHVKAELRSPLSGPQTDPGQEMPECYRVTDIVHAMPAGLWDSNVVSDYEFTDVQDGIFVRVRCPLAVVMDTFWRVREVDGKNGGGEGGLELVEEATIRCSRLLIGLVKGQCEEAWGKIHGKLIARLDGEV